MSRGPTITAAEITKAHELKKTMKLSEICRAMNRSEPTVRKMLRDKPREAPESLESNATQTEVV